MKKILAGACCALFALSLAACGGAPSSAPSSASSAPAAPASLSESAPPASSASTPAPSSEAAPAASASGEESTPVPHTIGEDGAVTFGGLHLQVDPAFSITEDDASLVIAFEEQQSLMTVIASKGMDLEEGSALAGLLPSILLQSYVSAFENVTNQQNFELEVAGVAAQGVTFFGEMQGNWVNCSMVAFEAGSYVYGLSFNERSPAESHVDDYSAVLESLSLEA